MKANPANIPLEHIICGRGFLESSSADPLSESMTEDTTSSNKTCCELKAEGVHNHDALRTDQQFPAISGL